MIFRLAVVAGFAVFHINAHAEKLEHKSSLWNVYSSVDRISDETECYARSKQGLQMWARTGVLAPVQLHSTLVQYRYGKKAPMWKSLDLEESKSRWVELSVYRPTDDKFRNGNVAEYDELRVESEHVFGKKQFAKFSLAGATEALFYIQQCREKYNVKDINSDYF